MAEKQNPQPSESGDSTGSPRRSGHHTDVRDAIAELAERAQVISQEAGTKVSSAMKDVISAAAGIAGFAIESARDLVQYMVRRGQMTPEEGEKLIRDAEAAHDKRSPGEKARATASKVAAERAAAAKAEAAARAAAQPYIPTRFASGTAKPVTSAPAKQAAHAPEKSAKSESKPEAKSAKAAPVAKSAKPAKAPAPAKPVKSAKPAPKPAKKKK
jgi:polyhydroxyalkanoate synthesis regulator phasin